MNPAIGECPCPFCAKTTTVHRAKGKHSQPLYLRCGKVFAGPKSDGCGVNQCRGPSAQAWIMQNATFYESSDREKIADAVAPVAEVAAAEVVDDSRKLREQQQKAAAPKEPEPAKPKSNWLMVD